MAETIKDIENRVKEMSESALRTVVDDDKWSTLEKKYGNRDPTDPPTPLSRINSAKKIEKSDQTILQTKTGQTSATTERPKELIFGPRKSSKTTPSPGSKGGIRELTEKWESRSSLTTPTSSVASNDTVKQFDMETSFFLPSESAEWESFDPQEIILPPANPSNQSTPNNSFPEKTTRQNSHSDRKYSVPIYGSDVTDSSTDRSGNSVVRMRDNKKNNVAPSRPSSLIETGAGTELKVFEMGHLGDHPGRHISASTSRGSSQADLLECSTSSDTPKSPFPGRNLRTHIFFFFHLKKNKKSSF